MAFMSLSTEEELEKLKTVYEIRLVKGGQGREVKMIEFRLSTYSVERR